MNNRFIVVACVVDLVGVVVYDCVVVCVFVVFGAIGVVAVADVASE